MIGSAIPKVGHRHFQVDVSLALRGSGPPDSRWTASTFLTFFFGTTYVSEAAGSNRAANSRYPVTRNLPSDSRIDNCHQRH